MIVTTKMKTEAASMISCYDHKKKYDMYCKKLLSNKQVLAYVMKGCVPEYAGTLLKDTPPYIEMSSISTADHGYIDDYRAEVMDETMPGIQIKYDIQSEVTIPIEQKEADKSTPADRKVRMTINPESQAKDDPGYPLIKRALCYCSRSMAKQKHPRNGFQYSDYNRIKKVYSTWTRIGYNNQKNDVVNTYRMQETCETEI